MKKKKDTYHPRKIQNIDAIGVRGVFVVVQSLLVRSVNPPWAILSHMEKWATMEACDWGHIGVANAKPSMIYLIWRKKKKKIRNFKNMF